MEMLAGFEIIDTFLRSLSLLIFPFSFLFLFFGLSSCLSHQDADAKCTLALFRTAVSARISAAQLVVRLGHPLIGPYCFQIMLSITLTRLNFGCQAKLQSPFPRFQPLIVGLWGHSVPPPRHLGGATVDPGNWLEILIDLRLFSSTDGSQLTSFSIVPIPSFQFPRFPGSPGCGDTGINAWDGWSGVSGVSGRQMMG